MRVPRRIKGDLVFAMREKVAEASRYPRSRIDETLINFISAISYFYLILGLDACSFYALKQSYR